MLLKKHLILLLICFWAFTNAATAQRDIPKKPQEKKDQSSVYDYGNMLSDIDSLKLNQKLIRYSDTTSTQIVVATIASLQGENIGIYAARWAHKWGIGQAKDDNGVFVLVAKNDRKISISPGYGAEIKLTAGINGTIIRNVILPEFKQGNFYGGLDKGTTAIFEVLNGSFEGTRQANNTDFPIGTFILVFFIFIIIMIAISKNNRGGGNGGNRKQGDSLLDVIILSNMGRGSYGGGSFGGGFGGSSGGDFGGGGFGGGFGGGGFSGGGATGSW